MRSAIPRLAAGETVPAPLLPAPAVTPLAADELARYQGTFELGNGTKLVIRARRGAVGE